MSFPSGPFSHVPKIKDEVPSTVEPIQIEENARSSLKNPGRIDDMDNEADTIMKVGTRDVFDGIKVEIANPVYIETAKMSNGQPMRGMPKTLFSTQHSFTMGSTFKHGPPQGYAFFSRFATGPWRLEGSYYFSNSAFQGSTSYRFTKIPLSIRGTVSNSSANRTIGCGGNYKGKDYTIGFEITPGRSIEAAFVQQINSYIRAAVHWVWQDEEPHTNYQIRYEREQGWQIWTARVRWPGLGALFALSQKLTVSSWWSTYLKLSTEDLSKSSVGLGLCYNLNSDRTVKIKLDSSWKLMMTIAESIADRVFLTTSMQLDYATNGLKVGMGFIYA